MVLTRNIGACEEDKTNPTKKPSKSRIAKDEALLQSPTVSGGQSQESDQEDDHPASSHMGDPIQQLES